MSRPRFLADNDLNDAIVKGVLRREPAIEFVRIRDLGLATQDDIVVLQTAARDGWIVVSHDVNTMIAAASSLLAESKPMNGLLMVHQRASVSETIDSLILTWSASEAREWQGLIAHLPF